MCFEQPTKALINFTKDWTKHRTVLREQNNVDENGYFTDEDGDPEYKGGYDRYGWARRCITSSELTFTDEGKKKSKYQNIYVEKDQWEVYD